MEEKGIVTFEDAECIRKSLGMEIEEFIKLLKVSRSTYYLWKQRGISGTAQQLLRVIELNIADVMEALVK